MLQNNKKVMPVLAFFLIFMTLHNEYSTAADKPSELPLKVRPQTFVYECAGGFHFVAEINENSIGLFLPGETVNLPQVPAASGVRYEKDALMFWSKSNEAMLDTGEQSYRACVNNPKAAIWEAAKLNGVDFRAAGNEPGWYLELSSDQKSLFVGDYGEIHYEFTRPDHVTDQALQTTRYELNEDNLTLSIELKLETDGCKDTMSDDVYETTVTVEFNGKQFNGCGKALH